MSYAFDVLSAGLEDLRVPLEQEDLKAAISDLVQYWHDTNHDLKDVVNQKSPATAIERINVARRRGASG